MGGNELWRVSTRRIFKKKIKSNKFLFLVDYWPEQKRFIRKMYYVISNWIPNRIASQSMRERSAEEATRDSSHFLKFAIRVYSQSWGIHPKNSYYIVSII